LLGVKDRITSLRLFGTAHSGSRLRTTPVKSDPWLKGRYLLDESVTNLTGGLTKDKGSNCRSYTGLESSRE
jgi:hypothetical protein